MKIKLFPSSSNGVAETSPSKSITHRAIICASFCKNATSIINPLISDDTIATIKAMKMMGVKFEYDKKNTELKIIPPKKLSAINGIIDCNESGTTFRFLLPIILSFQNVVTFMLGERLLNRITEKELQELKVDYTKSENNITFFKRDDSSIVLNDWDTTQYISGSLIAGAINPKQNTIKIKNKALNSYITLTLDIMEKFGIKYSITNTLNDITNEFCTEVSIINSSFTSPKNFFVEGDYSNAANILVGGLVGNKAICKGLYPSSLQGDSRIIDIIKMIGGNISIGTNLITTSASNLKPLEISLDDIPDLGPLLIGLATIIDGTSIFTNYHRLFNKESNRLADTIQILSTLGASITIDKLSQKLIVNGQNLLSGGVSVDTKNDHRLLFMLFVVSNKIISPIEIENASCYSKSFPNFLREMNNLGYKFQIEE